MGGDRVSFLETIRPDHRMVIVRNPWARLVSAYQDKIVKSKWALQVITFQHNWFTDFSWLIGIKSLVLLVDIQKRFYLLHCLAYLIVLNLRVVGAVRAKNYARSSFSWWTCSMTKLQSQDLSILSQNTPRTCNNS